MFIGWFFSAIVNFNAYAESIQFHEGIYYYKIRLFTKNSLAAERNPRSFHAATPGRNSRSFRFIRGTRYLVAVSLTLELLRIFSRSLSLERSEMKRLDSLILPRSSLFSVALTLLRFSRISFNRKKVFLGALCNLNGRFRIQFRGIKFKFTFINIFRAYHGNGNRQHINKWNQFFGL